MRVAAATLASLALAAQAAASAASAHYDQQSTAGSFVDTVDIDDVAIEDLDAHRPAPMMATPPPCKPKACPSHAGRTFCPSDPASGLCDKPPRKGPCPAGPCGAPGPPPGKAIKVDLAAAKTRWDGLGGLSSGGSTRLLADYPEKQRSDFLDLLFAKKGGAAFQILKTEVGGDGDSSYGSESSTMHTANRAEDNFHEGYETWLLQEAKKRNPEIPTYCLSWTTPAWTASDSPGPNRTFMNPTGAVR